MPSVRYSPASEMIMLTAVEGLYGKVWPFIPPVSIEHAPCTRYGNTQWKQDVELLVYDGAGWTVALFPLSGQWSRST